ncbi:MAG: hypothetical protein LUH55_06270 [Bacteroides thetaiotaomicron]|nr:hypothetical protein [Bacteroides thetaiotaomicron]
MSGILIKLLDSDDWYQTENLKKFINVLKETSADCVLTYHYAFDEGNGNLTIINGFENVPEGEYEIEKSNIDERFSIKNATYKTEMLKNMKERLTEHCFYTDAEFAVYPVAYVNTVCVCHLPIYVYRIGREGQSVSATGIKKHYKEQEMVFWNVLNFYIEKMNEATPVKRNVIWYTLAMLYHNLYKFHCILPMSKGMLLEIKE